MTPLALRNEIGTLICNWGTGEEKNKTDSNQKGLAIHQRLFRKVFLNLMLKLTSSQSKYVLSRAVTLFLQLDCIRTLVEMWDKSGFSNQIWGWLSKGRSERGVPRQRKNVRLLQALTATRLHRRLLPCQSHAVYTFCREGECSGLWFFFFF